MNVNETIVTDVKCHRKCLSWTAVFAGALAGIGISFLMYLFGVSIGLAAFATTDGGTMGDAATTTLAIGGFIGLVIAAIVPMFVCGWIAGFLGGFYSSSRAGELYGFIAWCVALVLSLMLAANMGQFAANPTYFTNPTNVTLTTNPNAPAVSSNPSGTNVTVNTTTAAKAFSAASFVTFFLFFIGAISSCFGGRVGIHACKKCCANDPSCPK